MELRSLKLRTMDVDTFAQGIANEITASFCRVPMYCFHGQPEHDKTFVVDAIAGKLGTSWELIEINEKGEFGRLMKILRSPHEEYSQKIFIIHWKYEKDEKWRNIKYEMLWNTLYELHESQVLAVVLTFDYTPESTFKFQKGGEAETVFRKQFMIHDVSKEILFPVVSEQQ